MQYHTTITQFQSTDDTQQYMQLKELHQNFINDNSFINIGQVITKTLELIAINESSNVQQKLNYHQTKAGAKNIVGSVLYDALSKLAIRVTCGATNSDKHKYPITHLHIRCLCCNQNVCIKTLDLLDQCVTIDNAHKSDASDTEDVLFFDKLTDLIINDLSNVTSSNRFNVCQLINELHLLLQKAMRIH